MLKIAVPNKGRLSEDAIQLLKDAGYNCSKSSSNELSVRDTDNDIEFFFIRPKDIPAYVTSGVLDIGITGRDLAIDNGKPFAELMTLEFGKAHFCFAAPNESELLPEKLSGKRIATSYPGLVQKYLDEKGIQAALVVLNGAVEISIRLGVADVIADVVQSGRTLKANGLKVIGEPLVVSEAVVLAKEGVDMKNAEVKIFCERLRGIITARKYMILEYDILKTSLEDACRITPGIESPTISPLNKEEWLAVKAMVPTDKVNLIMDQLKEIGAKGIIASKITACRL